MEYFVTGGTGFIGTRLVGQLVDDGHDVIVLTRSRENADHLPSSVTIVEGDVTNTSRVREGMEGVDGVFHLAGWFHNGSEKRNRKKAERVNVRGTKTVLELVDELTIPKAVYTSTVTVYGNTGGTVVDENFLPEDPGQADYSQSKWRAHAEVVRPMIDDGLPVVVVLPGAVIGPGDGATGSIRELFTSWLQGDLPVIPRGFTLPFDYVDDVAAAHVAAMENGERGEEYIIAGEPRGLVDIFDCATAMTDRPAPRTISPAWFTLLATVLSPVHRVRKLPPDFDPETLRTYGNTEVLVDNSKAIEELGIEHRDFEDGLREYLEWEIEQLDVDAATLRHVA